MGIDVATTMVVLPLDPGEPGGKTSRANPV